MRACALCAWFVFTIFQTTLFRPFLKRILLILCVVFAKSVDERWNKCVKVIKYLRSKLVPPSEPWRKKERNGETCKVRRPPTVRGSDREYVVAGLHIVRKNYPNNGLDGGAIAVKPRQNGDDHDINHVCVCVCEGHLKSGRNRVTRSQLLSWVWQPQWRGENELLILCVRVPQQRSCSSVCVLKASL